MFCCPQDGQFALSGSWDATLRLWDLNTGVSQQYAHKNSGISIIHSCVHARTCASVANAHFAPLVRRYRVQVTTRRFIGHSKDVLSVAFSADNRQIVSGSRDRSINLWNTLGQLKYSITDDGHKEWVSCVRFSPNLNTPLIVSAGWDRLVKVWNLNNCKLRTNLVGHQGYVNTVTVSPDGSLCASGGKDGVAMLWDLNEVSSAHAQSEGVAADDEPEETQLLTCVHVACLCSLTRAATCPTSRLVMSSTLCASRPSDIGKFTPHTQTRSLAGFETSLERESNPTLQRRISASANLDRHRATKG